MAGIMKELSGIALFYYNSRIHYIDTIGDIRYNAKVMGDIK